ncbi:MAG: SIR2 family protein [Nitrospirae bacterium]|nr:SIR2 family protein [Nitrospirota bacterium]MBF0536533.1 SIR2 family protein [Nitrospirota bacterium]MBF0616620.1 SIR2 family protein [Nitrospirota bacterium]
MSESDKNVYILGAGFSKGLGLPLQDDFLQTARTIYFKDTDKYKHFNNVFDYIDKLSKIRNYVSISMFNLENIFNLLEMNLFFTEGTKHEECELRKKDFIKLIADVLQELTPKPFREHPTGMTIHPGYHHYAAFLSLLLKDKPTLHYDSIITFNYDLIVEASLRIINYYRINDNHIPEPPISCDYMKSNENIRDKSIGGFDVPVDLKNTNSTLRLKLFKLHGSINWETKDGETFLVPPTWNKSDTKIKDVWTEVYKELSTATRLIIIGYSFPETDIYAKSLLALAINNNKNLQNIYFINPDTNEVKKRSLDFIDTHFIKHTRYREMDFFKFVEDESWIDENLKRRSIRNWMGFNRLKRLLNK